MSNEHYCKQDTRIMRLETDAATAEAERRELREEILHKMDMVVAEVVGIANSSKSIVDSLRADVDTIRRRLAEVDTTIDSRTKAAFARIDELRDLLGAKGHA